MSFHHLHPPPNSDRLGLSPLAGINNMVVGSCVTAVDTGLAPEYVRSLIPSTLDMTTLHWT